MLKESYQPKLPGMDGLTQQEHRYCSMSLENWKDEVTEQRGEYSQRKKLALHIGERGCLSWPTVRANEWKGCPVNMTRKDGKDRRDTLDAVVKYGPRDRERSSTNGNHQGLSNWRTSAAERQKSWATPNTMDALPPRSPEGVLKQALGARAGRTKPANLREQVDPMSCEIYEKKQTTASTTASTTEKLNPAWVETIMGLPIGWTQLSGVTDPHENRIDRLRLLGNGVVPQTAEKALRTLVRRFNHG